MVGKSRPFFRGSLRDSLNRRIYRADFPGENVLTGAGDSFFSSVYTVGIVTSINYITLTDMVFLGDFLTGLLA
ncbi:MAG: hypothetical protein LUD78_03605 [Clostridiales bacterium]|nr:hypothetical protein [Clostridiales bacterium]